MSLFAKDNGKRNTVKTTEPALAPPAQARRTPVRIEGPVHQEAAAFAQSVMNLQNELDHYRQQCDALNNNYYIVQGELQRREVEIQTLQSRLDYYQSRCITITARFNTIATLILEVLSEAKQDQEDDNRRLKAIEDEIHKVEPAPAQPAPATATTEPSQG